MKNNINNKDIMSVKNLYFKYRRNDDYIIRAASFSIKEGMLYGMVGKNSVGKSTLLKLLCGREDKHTGVALCMITAGLILIYMGRYETLEGLVFASIGTIILDTGYLTYKLLNPT